ncbi:MAG TPA: glucose-6-phosphate dehydrogenase [Armatimonadetes bacterium]|nr:glucose-6-phosphate dehydrogenase [Armatimonadota bacterium]
MSESANPFREGLARLRAPEPCVFVLFGATGDLTARKLLPALWQLVHDGLAPKHFYVLGVARRPKTDDEFRAEVRAAVTDHGRHKPEDDGEWADFAGRLGYHQSEFHDEAGFAGLAERLSAIDAEMGTTGNRLYYLAVAPEFFEVIADQLAAHDLIGPDEGSGWRRLVVEKPFGEDLPSAQALSRHLHQLVGEEQIYRIDHYLGKETVQNLLTLRFGNAIFEPLWNRRYIDNVQITVAETEGIGRRGEFYDQTGGLRDMVQNHMMQLLALVAMEPPVTWEAGAIRDEKAKVLKALPDWSPEQVAQHVVRAQYVAGALAGVDHPGYREENGVADDSLTETYAALRLTLDTWRWSGVPFYLRHGKRLPKRSTEVAIAFRQPPLTLFPEAVGATGNTLVLRIQPDEGISLNFLAKIPGTRLTLQAVKMEFGYGSSFAAASPEAYERLILDALVGDNTLFTRQDEVASAWRFIDAVRAGLAEQPAETMLTYPVGSWGPPEAAQLLGPGQQWRRL